MLGLITDQERQEQHKNASILTQRRTAAQREPLLAHQAAVDHGRVTSFLGVDLDPPDSGLFGSQARTEVQRRTIDLQQRMSVLTASDRRADLQATLEQAVAVEVNAQRDVDDTGARLTAERVAVEQLTASAAGDGQSALLAELPPSSGFCSVPMNLARERDCPLAMSRPIDFTARRSERTAAQELVDHQNILASLHAVAETKRQAHSRAKQATSAAREAYLLPRPSMKQRGDSLRKKARLAQVERVVRDAEQAWNQSKRACRGSEGDRPRRSMRLKIGGSNPACRNAAGNERFSATFDTWCAPSLATK